ncbi:MAG: glycosyltransferase [Bacteroidota bacterium]
MPVVNLSYIIATYNRLPFLKITLEKLISELQPDEEIVVIDGDSIDGTKNYLQELFNTGKIQRFISEPDKNQAQAWNKAMLLANGIILKKVIDDDVFCYESIRKCKAYMLDHPDVDVVISDDLAALLNDNAAIEKRTRLPQFEKWRNGLIASFSFSDVNILIRRSALSYIGLYNTSFTMMDWEYSLRISYLKTNIVYFTGYNSLTVAHAQTVTSSTNKKSLTNEGDKGAILYNYLGDNSETSNWSKVKIFIGKLVYERNKLVPPIINNPDEKSIGVIYDYYYTYINALNQSGSFVFLGQD